MIMWMENTVKFLKKVKKTVDENSIDKALSVLIDDI